MASESPLDRQAFLHLAAQGGLDVNSSHMDELYSYVQSVLAGLRPLYDLKVDEAEPDMAFVPPRD